jgi:hypothetical protein
LTRAIVLYVLYVILPYKKETWKSLPFLSSAEEICEYNTDESFLAEHESQLTEKFAPRLVPKEAGKKRRHSK